MAKSVYDIMVRFRGDDRRVTPAFQRVQKQADKTAKSIQKTNKQLDRFSNKSSGPGTTTTRGGRGGRGGLGALGGSLLPMAAIAAAGYGLAKLTKKLVDLNGEAENTKMTLATMLIHTGQNTNFDRALERGSEAMAQMRKEAEMSPATFAEIRDFSSLISTQFAQSGKSIEHLASFTRKAAVAAKAFGERPIDAARDVRSMLVGNVTSRDRFAKTLLAGVGVSVKKFNAMTKKEQVKTIEETLNHPAIEKASKVYATTFDGAWSTFKSRVTQFFTTAGGGLTKTLTGYLNRLNTWWASNSNRINEVAEKVSKAISTTFTEASKVIKHVSDFMSHTGLTSSIKSLAGAIRELISSLPSLDKTTDTIADYFHDFFGQSTHVDKMKKTAGNASERMIAYNTMLREGRELRDLASLGIRQTTTPLSPVLSGNAPASTSDDRAPNINIQMDVNATIEVASDDPDRFAIGLQNYFKDSIKNPAQAATAFREGV